MNDGVRSTEHRLTLPEIVDALVADGLVAAETAGSFIQERRYFRGDMHPLVVIAEQRWKSLLPPHRTLTLEELTQWLAQWRENAFRPRMTSRRTGYIGTEIQGMGWKSRWKWWPLIAASSRSHFQFALMGESVRPRPIASR